MHRTILALFRLATIAIALMLLMYLVVRHPSRRESSGDDWLILELSTRMQLKSNSDAGVLSCSDLLSQYSIGSSSIPPIVHWTSKTGRVAARLRPLVATWRRLLNSSQATWRFMHWDDQQLSRLISKRYPYLASSYAKLVNGLERSDIGRLVVLHYAGGVYVDMDVELRRDLSDWLRPSSAAANCCSAIWSQEPVEHSLFLFNSDRLISNAVILSKANHSFLNYVLHKWPAWFEANWAAKPGRVHNDATLVTGPMMLNHFFEQYLDMPAADRPADWAQTLLADADLFEPIWDEAYAPGKLRQICARPSQLSEAKKRHCQRLSAGQFRTKPIPEGSYTVHRFLHVSYTDKMDLLGSCSIADLFPLLNCTI